MPRQPRWLLSIPDAIAKLDKLKRDTLIRKDLETLFGVSTMSASRLMKKFGADRVAQTAVLPKAKLLEYLRAQRKRAPFRHEANRRQAVVDELQRARITGIRVPMPKERLGAKLGNTPPGITVTANRIEVTFATAKEAVQQMFTVAQVLTNDYARFEQLVDGGHQPAGAPLETAPARRRENPLTRRELGRRTTR